MLEIESLRVRQLLDSGIDINSLDDEGNTVLMIAAAKGRSDIVRELLSVPNIDINTTNNNGSSALILAIDSFPDIVNSLFGSENLVSAIKKNYENTVFQLLGHPKIKINTIDDSGQSALSISVAKGYTEIVQKLLSFPEIDINIRGNYGYTPLMFAASINNTKILQHLISVEGINLNAKDKNGNTALIIAAEKGLDIAVAQLVAAKGIDVNAKNDFGDTALISAVEKGHSYVTAALIKSPEINLHVRNCCGKKALIIAAEKNHVAQVMLLLQKLIKEDYDINKYLPQICRLASADLLKSLVYSETINILEYDLSENKFLDSDKHAFATNMKNKLSTLLNLKVSDATAGIANRLSLLEAKLCGLRFKEDVVSYFAGISMPKFRAISSIMRFSALVKLSYGFNPYMFSHMLMLGSMQGSKFSGLTTYVRFHLLGFLLGDHFVVNMQDVRDANPNIPKLKVSESNTENSVDYNTNNLNNITI